MMARSALPLSDARKVEVETLAAVLTTEQIAECFGIGRTPFFAMMQRDAAIAERYERGKAHVIGAIAQTLITKVRAGDTAWMILFLETEAGWRETRHLEQSKAAEKAEAHEAAAHFFDLLNGVTAQHTLPAVGSAATGWVDHDR